MAGSGKAKGKGKGNGSESMQRWKSVWMKLRRCCSCSCSCSVGKNQLSLGIGTDYGSNHMKVIIPRNAGIPTRREITVVTLRDNQTTMYFPVYEGERILSKSNNLLGELTLRGLPPAPRGIVEVHVRFAVDANGTITVEAEHKASGRKSGISITKENRKEEIEEMLQDAEMYKMKDGEYKKKHEAIIALRSYVYTMRKAINTVYYMLTLTPAEEKKMEAAFNSALRWLDANADAEPHAFQHCLEQLNTICLQIMLPS